MQTPQKLDTKITPRAASNAEAGSMLISANIEILKQLLNCSECFDDETYTCCKNQTSSIGAHMRHIIEFYKALVTALKDPQITHVCYDNRQRDLKIENSKSCARDEIKNLIIDFTALNGDEQLKTLSSIVTPEMPMETMHTSPNRELFYVLDHAIHHMALIKMIAKNANIFLDKNFGIANSTQAHLKQNQS